MVTVSNLHEATQHLPELVERAASGEEIIIAKGGVPLAKLVALRERSGPRKPGGWEGRATISDDFDTPLPAEIADAFGGS